MTTEKLKINDARIEAVPVSECGEILTDIRKLQKVVFPSQIRTPTNEEDSLTPWVRTGVFSRLERVVDSLNEGESLLFIEGFRLPAVQRRIFDLEVKRVGRSEIAEVMVANPDKFTPHLTGGAVDLGIVDRDLKLLDFGNLFEHDKSAYMLCETLTEPQKVNRERLTRLMTEAGFVNYPYEWWHWSYGDKYWGYANGTAACYDIVLD